MIFGKLRGGGEMRMDNMPQLPVAGLLSLCWGIVTVPASTSCLHLHYHSIKLFLAFISVFMYRLVDKKDSIV